MFLYFRYENPDLYLLIGKDDWISCSLSQFFSDGSAAMKLLRKKFDNIQIIHIKSKVFDAINNGQLDFRVHPFLE